MNKLNLKDRVVLGSAMPSTGKFQDLIIGEDIKSKIRINQDELVKYEIKQLDSGVQWKDNSDEFEFNFSELEISLIKKTLIDLSDKSQLTVDHLSLYRMFL